jgi:WD40 repeat protein/DNA-binding SARP family transcriptional activator
MRGSPNLTSPMSRSSLSIRLLGPFQVTLNGQPVVGFISDKVRALLAYLAAEADRPHRREALAGLLWPEWPERTARTNLRRALANLRRVIGDHEATPPFLLITRQTIQFNSGSESWVDANAFTALLEAPGAAIRQLEEAVALYRGDFLEGFSIADSAAFEEWALLKREQLGRQVVAALFRLAGYYEGRDAYEQALPYAWRQVELESWEEPAHRQLMRLLALSGQRNAALAQYEALRDQLAEELSVEPEEETTRLYERIRDGEIEADVRERLIRGYELRERIGAGGFGVVYRAYQPSVGREVAIKVILPEYANHPDFIRRFEAEAQLVARLEHLHIVPLYDYWREPDSAYLVMRWLRGGNLRESLRRAPWTSEAAARLLDQVAGALTVAHRQSVVHRDVKPENILLDEEGNGYLSDFGVAKDLLHPAGVTEAGAIVGSPAYVSPEQARGRSITPQSDLYSLGVVMHQVLTGEHPFPGVTPAEQLIKHLTEPLPPLRERRPDLPHVLEDVIQRATAKEPAERYPDALAFAAAFREAVAGPAVEVITPPDWVALEVVNPYKGLRAFEEADAADFFGRELLIERLLARLTPTPSLPLAGEGSEGGPSAGSEQGVARFLAVVGPSGSGKSSLVKAGLLPALRRGALPGSEEWFVVEMLPGAHPLDELEIGLLRIAVDWPTGLMEQLRRDERGLLRATRLALPTEDSELLLVIDQFEELFTQAVDRTESEHLMRNLYAAVTDPQSQVRVVITLRADFYDRPLMHPEFSSLMRQRTEVVVPLTPEELAQAIREPAERTGAELEPGLVAAIVADVSEQPGALPMLQYALTELFERREGRLLTREAYQAIGGVSGALARRAEVLYAGLDSASQELARQLFLRLVKLGEGAGGAAASPDTRQRVLRPVLTSLGGDSEVMEGVIDAFGKHRLLTFDRDPETRTPTVEIAHEALLREWGRLREWVEASRDDVRAHQRLTGAAAEWIKTDRDPGSLLRGTRLDQFESWADTTDLALGQVERDYLETSLAERRAREAEEAKRQAREKALERRSRSFLWALVVVLLLATVVALGLAGVARRAQTVAEGEAQARATQQAIAEAEAEARATQQAIAEHQARVATSRELAMAALNNLDVDPERSILLALQAVTETYSVDQTVLREAEEALHRAVHASRVVLTVPQGRADAFSPDMTRFATIGEDSTATIWDAATGAELFTLRGHTDMVGMAIFSPDGTRLATASLDTTARVWDAETGEQLLVLSGHTDSLVGLAFSPDGTRLATSSFDGTARIWDTTTGEELLTLFHTAVTAGVAFSPDGARLAVADHDAFVARVWDAEIGEELLVLTGHAEGVNDVVFSPDGMRLATASSDVTAKVWDAVTGEGLLTLEGHSGFVFGVDFGPDGTLVATGSEDGTAKVWDAATGEELLTLAGHIVGIGDVAFSADGTYLATSSADEGIAKVWDISPQGSRELLTLAGHSEPVFHIAYSSDGTRLATASFDGTAKVWDVSTGAELLTLTGHSAWVYGVAFSPDRARLATASQDGTAKVWNAETGQELLTLEGHAGFVFDTSFSPDGTQLATASGDGTAKVWDAKTGELLLTLEGHTTDIFGFPSSEVFSVAFSPDGNRLATAGWDGTVKVWEASTGEELLTLRGHTSRVNGVAFSPDGRCLASVGWDGMAKVWDVSAGEEILTLSGHAGVVWDVAFDPDGTHLATVGFDNTTRLWDLEAPATAASGQELLILTGHKYNTSGVAFSPDGIHLAASGGGGTVRIYVLPIEDLMALARARVTRSLTDEECQQYLHVDRCPPGRGK